MKNNYLSPDGFQSWLKKEQHEENSTNVIGKKVYSKLNFSDLLESIEIIDGNDFEIAKYFKKHGSKVIEYSSQGTLTLENKKGKFIIEETNTKKHQN
jgi:hypothetical protein